MSAELYPTVSQGMLSVNAAFLQEIKDDNRELHELLDAMHMAVSSSSRDGYRLEVFCELPARVRDQLATHFSLEEAYGYFEDAKIATPHLSNTADILRAQHETLFSEICDIVDAAEDLLYHSHLPRQGGFNTICRRWSTFYHQLMDHEEGERELIMQSMYDDIGVGD